jgi:hypothetical protein
MKKDKKNKPSKTSVRLAMDNAWRDYHHARGQGWKALLTVLVIGAAFLTIDIHYHNMFVTLGAALLTIAAGFFGANTTLNFRKLERRKFIHILNCEQYLGLLRDDLIPLKWNQKLAGREESEMLKKKGKDDSEWEVLISESSVKIPAQFKFYDIIHPRRHNSSLFMVRMHYLVILFTLLLMALRIFKYFRWIQLPKP